MRLASSCFAFAVLLGSPLSADEPSSLEGHIVSRDSSYSISGAGLTILDGSNAMLVSKTTSDGRFHFIGILPGDIIVLVQRAGFLDSQLSCRIDPGSTSRLVIHLEMSSIPPVHLRSPQSAPDACRAEPDTSDRYIIR